MFKRLVAITALAVGTAAFAHADSINGFFAVDGTDAFTPPPGTLTFQPGATVEGPIGGTFATYLTDGNPVTFASSAIPYAEGNNIPGVSIPIFSTKQNGETFLFTVSSFNAMFETGGAVGCLAGNTCLLITGDGTFSGVGVVNYDPTPGVFEFESSYVPGQTIGQVTTFAAQASATPLPSVPEPASLALFGTGLVGIVGIARRKLRV